MHRIKLSAIHIAKQQAGCVLHDVTVGRAVFDRKFDTFHDLKVAEKITAVFSACILDNILPVAIRYSCHICEKHSMMFMITFN